jgi:hypothetical protein
MTAGMGLMGLGLLMLALIPLNDSFVLIESGLLAMGCGLGLNVGPMNAVAVANVPAVRSGTASGLINTASMIGATLGVAVLGAMFAMHVADWRRHAGASRPPISSVGSASLSELSWRSRSSAVTHCAGRRNKVQSLNWRGARPNALMRIVC